MADAISKRKVGIYPNNASSSRENLPQFCRRSAHYVSRSASSSCHVCPVCGVDTMMRAGRASRRRLLLTGADDSLAFYVSTLAATSFLKEPLKDALGTVPKCMPRWNGSRAVPSEPALMQRQTDDALPCLCPVRSRWLVQPRYAAGCCDQGVELGPTSPAVLVRLPGSDLMLISTSLDQPHVHTIQGGMLAEAVLQPIEAVRARPAAKGCRR